MLRCALPYPRTLQPKLGQTGFYSDSDELKYACLYYIQENGEQVLLPNDETNRQQISSQRFMHFNAGSFLAGDVYHGTGRNCESIGALLHLPR